MDYLQYFNDVFVQKQIDKIAKKCKNKRIVIYGVGEYFQILKNNFDISKLNIVAYVDKKFENNNKENEFSCPTLAPCELKYFDCDLILVAVYQYYSVEEFLKYRLLIDGINSKTKIQRIIRPTFSYVLKSFFS